jgi:NAD(P)-dependent dehydrogenase (short-subunit alcohol dehydrogenase family)
MRFSELLDSEYGEQGLLTFHVHPGGVATELSSTVRPDYAQFQIDKPEMAADTIVWLTAEKRPWLSGRYVSAAWDMEELLAKKERVVKEKHLVNKMIVGLE